MQFFGKVIGYKKPQKKLKLTHGTGKPYELQSTFPIWVLVGKYIRDCPKLPTTHA